uniref:Uncharacterized protein n=1 Tax=Macaca fascicularis TaxID=9541 RepID=A0A7N9CQH3_MACFA
GQEFETSRYSVLVLKAEVGGSPEVRSSRPAWPTWQNPISTKNTKISQAWWRVPVILATRKAEEGELLEPRRWSKTPFLKEKKKKSASFKQLTEADNKFSADK